jgi:homocitrate synthase
MAQNGLQANSNNQPKEAASSPYMSKDPYSNVNNFKIIESTLRGNIQSISIINH